jgi:hypothetical protein
MISEEDFTGLIACALEMLPMMRQLSTTTLAMIYVQLPRKTIEELNSVLLQYAIKQRLLDPSPPNNMAFHMQLFRYLYPLENNAVVFERGFRSDLRERISKPDTFHDPSPQREEFMSPNHDEFRLPPSAYWHPNKMSAEQWQKHFKTLKVQVAMVDQNIIEPLELWQLLKGKDFYEQALKGFWLLNVDTGKTAHNWIARNKNLAQEMLETAIKERLGSVEDTTTKEDDVPW